MCIIIYILLFHIITIVALIQQHYQPNYDFQHLFLGKGLLSDLVYGLVNPGNPGKGKDPQHLLHL